MQGTKWCGAGNNADNENDLGDYADVDSCCRTHDHCARKVGAFSEFQGYRNWLPFTVSDCACDEKFYACLKDVKENPTVASIVGNVFFDVLSMPCINVSNGKATKGSSKSYKK